MVSIVHDMPAEEYHAHPALGSTSMTRLARSVAHLQAPRVETDSMKLGTVAHTAVLEPNLFSQRYFVRPKVDGRTKDGKKSIVDAEAAAEGRAVITTEDYDQAMRTADSVREFVGRCPIPQLLTGRIESSGFATLDGIECKARPDIWHATEKTLVDLKRTARDSRLDSFARSLATYGYHQQAPHYLDVFTATGAPVDCFLFLVVEAEEPHAAQLYELDAMSIQIGREINRHARAAYAQHRETGERWIGYPSEIQIISLPIWAQRVA